VGHNFRFGECIYPLVLLFLAIAGVTLPVSRLRTAVLATLCLMAPLFIWNGWKFPPQMDAEPRGAMIKLVESLKSNGQGAESIYILNSARSFSGAEYLARLAGLRAHLVVLNEFGGCLDDKSGTSTFFRPTVSEMKIAVVLPPCASLVFDGIYKTTFAQGTGRSILRGDFAEYSFPEEKVTLGRRTKDPQFVNLGRQMNIALKGFDPQNSILLYYDWSAKRYRCIGDRCSTS
jgi:hypothetical protein